MIIWQFILGFGVLNLVLIEAIKLYFVTKKNMPINISRFVGPKEANPLEEEIFCFFEFFQFLSIFFQFFPFVELMPWHLFYE